MSKRALTFRVRIEPAGWEYDAPADMTLMASAREAGFVLPSSCRNGTCRTCMCRLVEGQVAYSIEWPGISTDESDDGWVLPCVAHPGSRVVLRVPHARLKSELDALLAQTKKRSRPF